MNATAATTSSTTTAEIGGADQPDTQHHLLVPDQTVNSSAPSWHGTNFTTTRPPTARRARPPGHRLDHVPQRHGQRGERLDGSVSFCYSTSSTTNCAGRHDVTASPASASGTRTPPRAPRCSGLAPGTEYWFKSRRSAASAPLRLGLNFTTLAAAPPPAKRRPASPAPLPSAQRDGQRQRRLDHSHLLLQHLEHVGNCGTCHLGERHREPRRRSSTIAESAALTSLTPNTMYWFKSRRSTAPAPWFGTQRVSRRTAAPTATTSAATSTTASTSTLNGTVNAENASTSVTFCYSTSSTIGNCAGTVTT